MQSNLCGVMRGIEATAQRVLRCINFKVLARTAFDRGSALLFSLMCLEILVLSGELKVRKIVNVDREDRYVATDIRARIKRMNPCLCVEIDQPEMRAVRDNKDTMSGLRANC